MSDDLKKIASFIEQHHVMSLATQSKGEISVCSLFYVYHKALQIFIIASNEETTHIAHIKQNQQVAGNILLETKKVGEIKGLQFRGEFRELFDAKKKLLYFKAFPYAFAMSPKLWQIEVNDFKLTDNALGFGNKLTWSRATS